MWPSERSTTGETRTPVLSLRAAQACVAATRILVQGEVREGSADLGSLELLPRLLVEPLASAASAIAGARTTWCLANRETYGLAV